MRFLHRLHNIAAWQNKSQQAIVSLLHSWTALLSVCGVTVPPSSFVFAATAENEGRLEAARARAGEEFRGQTAAEEPSAKPEGRPAEAPELACHPGQFHLDSVLLQDFGKQPCRGDSLCLPRLLGVRKFICAALFVGEGRLPNLHFNNKEMRSSVWEILRK